MDETGWKCLWEWGGALSKCKTNLIEKHHNAIPHVRDASCPFIGIPPFVSLASLISLSTSFVVYLSFPLRETNVRPNPWICGRESNAPISSDTFPPCGSRLESFVTSPPLDWQHRCLDRVPLRFASTCVIFRLTHQTLSIRWDVTFRAPCLPQNTCIRHLINCLCCISQIVCIDCIDCIACPICLSCISWIVCINHVTCVIQRSRVWKWIIEDV